MPCRINKRRLWSHRIMLESYKHSENSFLTLTYSPENLPTDGSLIPRDTQLWLKRFRKAIYPLTFRYFLVGEYGDISQRPHYHAALFGVGVQFQDLVADTWGKGHVMLGELTSASASYISGYVCKKLTNPHCPHTAKILAGRHPEFTRMSLKPGIGASAMDDLISGSGVHLWHDGDVPSFLRHGGKKMPLGRYLKEKIREKLGLCDTGTPQDKLGEVYDKMQALHEDFKADPENSYKSFKAHLIDTNKGRVASIEARARIFNNKKGVI